MSKYAATGHSFLAVSAIWLRASSMANLKNTNAPSMTLTSFFSLSPSV
jgi:hypothetical protein